MERNTGSQYGSESDPADPNTQPNLTREVTYEGRTWRHTTGGGVGMWVRMPDDNDPNYTLAGGTAEGPDLVNNALELTPDLWDHFVRHAKEGLYDLRTYPTVPSESDQLRAKGIARMDYPDDPAELGQRWRNSSYDDPSVPGNKVWVGFFDAVALDGQPTTAVLLTEGTHVSPRPDHTVLHYNLAEWDAFVGGAKDGEFNLEAMPGGPDDPA